MDYDQEVRYYLFRDKQFKSELKQQKDLLLEEFPVGNSRIDIAIINGKFVGYEIKSKQDTLAKLEKQIHDYSKIFNRITIVIHPTHLENSKTMIPDYVGITLTQKNKLIIEREPKDNPEIELKSIAGLLWKNELYQNLKEEKIRGISRLGREELAELYAHTFGKDTEYFVRERLKERKQDPKINWRPDKEANPWQKYLDNPSLIREALK